MSHLTQIDLLITDLSALAAAAVELGAEWRESQRTYGWFGTSVGDYPLPAGLTPEDLGKCDHAIHLPGCQYEIGVVRQKDESGYTLLYDFWGHTNAQGGRGEMLKSHFGDGLARLKQMYGVCRATQVARAKGYFVTRKTADNGAIKLMVTGV